jgi:hypothetical protein
VVRGSRSECFRLRSSKFRGFKEGDCLSLYTDYECKSELREKVRRDVSIWT